MRINTGSGSAARPGGPQRHTEDWSDWIARSPREHTSVHSPICGSNLGADADTLSCVQTTALPLA